MSEKSFPKYCPQCGCGWKKRQSPFSLNVWVYCDRCKANAETIIKRTNWKPKKIEDWTMQDMCDDDFLDMMRDLWGS